jgi:7-cyano-7-deazaguanine synthase in queuosine biosynthesis
VSHYATGRLKGIQNKLLSDLEKNFKGKFEYVSIQVKEKGKNEINSSLTERKQEYIQYSRSFLFLSLASTISLSLGINKVYMFENGILSINVPHSQSKIITSTKTTHPKIIKSYEELINELFGSQIEIINPFIYKTKGEIVELLKKSPFVNMIKESVSCSNYCRSKISNCGACYPCILRRISLNKANLDSFDSDYRKNIFLQYPNLNPKEQTLILDLYRFFKKFSNMTNEEILMDYPNFYIESLDPLQLISMYKRYGKELENCFNIKSNSQLRGDIGKI